MKRAGGIRMRSKRAVVLRFFGTCCCLRQKVRKILSGALPMTACLLLLSTALLVSSIASAETPKEEYQRLQKEMESHRRKIEEAKRREHSVLEEIDTANRGLDTVRNELRRQRILLQRTESEIVAVEAEIAANTDYLGNQRAWMKRKLQAMQRYGQSYELLVLFTGADDVAQIMRRWKYLEILALYERKAIEGYIGTLKRLQDKEKQLENLRVALRGSEDRIRQAEKTLAEKKKDRENLLSAVRSEKSAQEKMLIELEEASRKLYEVIRKLEEKETYEGRGFATLKGRLAWPVNGKVAIPYGSQKDPRFNTPVFRNGIYIKADDDSIKAVHEGKVVFADWFKGYGNLLIINHGEGYHTLYANLSEIFFRVGDIIKGQEVVGRAGESGIINAPSLYFEIRYKGKPLDPVQWLRKR